MLVALSPFMSSLKVDTPTTTKPFPETLTPLLAVMIPTASILVTSLYVSVPAIDTVVADTVVAFKVVAVTTPVTLTPLASTVVIPATVIESDNIVPVLATPVNPDPSPLNDVALITPTTSSLTVG